MTTATTMIDERADGADARVAMAFCVSHAPQILIGPPEEDPAEIERVHEGYRLAARRAAELELDAVCLVALDHLHNHFLNLVPMFTVFTGNPVVAEFNHVKVSVDGAPDLANGLVDHLLEAGFDPAFSQREVLDHSFMIPMHYAGFETPVIPIIINAYVPPQPSIGRCAAFGHEIAVWGARSGLRVGVVSTGGMSHYPGTQRFHQPDVASDSEVLGWLKAGEGNRLTGLSSAELDRRGMVEMRTWGMAIGARGSTDGATVHTYWDSGHCGYAIVEL